MSVKYFNREQNKWVIFPGTVGAPGKDAYFIAQENGYTGTKEEYINALIDIPNIKDQIGTVNETIAGVPNQIKDSIVDNLESLATDKSLSANQGRILKEMIANLASLRIEVVDQLPDEGELNVIYLVKKEGSELDTHDEYVFINNKWEKIGSTEIDLSNYYTKEEINEKEVVWDKVIEKPETYIPSAHTHSLSQITDIEPRLSDYYSKSETYSQSEIDEKIGSAGGGDVVTNGDLVADYIIIGAGTKSIKNSGQTLSNLALKNEIPSLSGYATQNWVNTQGFVTENSWRPIKVGGTTLNDNSTTLEIVNGAGINLEFNNGALTITNSGSSSAYSLPVAKDSVLGGIKTGYTESNGPEMAIYTLEDGTAYTLLKDTTIKAALGYTPADINDVPEIPIALPNPYSLNIEANNITTTYTGSSEATINLDGIFSKQLPTLTDPADAGKPGIFFTTDGTTQVNIVARVTKEHPDAIVVVPGTTPVVIDEPTVFTTQNIEELLGSVSGSYKCFSISWVAEAQTGLMEDLILVNGAVYG